MTKRASRHSGSKQEALRWRGSGQLASTDVIGRRSYAGRVSSAASKQVDDRGRPFTPLSLRAVREGDSGADGARAALAKRLKQGIQVEQQHWTWSGCAVSGLATVVWFIGYGALGALGGRGSTARLLWFWGGLVGLSLLGRVLARRRLTGAIAGTAVAEGYCGACGYDLESVPQADDGCLVCPECGAAWLAQRVTVPHWRHGPIAAAVERPRPGFAAFIGLVASARKRIASDDRGRFTTVLDTRLRVALPDRVAAMPDDARRALVADLRSIAAIWRWLFGLLLALVCMAVGLMLADSLGPGWGRFLALAGGIGLGATVGGLMVISDACATPRPTAEVIVRHGWCATCVRSLSDLTPAEDGCVACPDCGASWRVGEARRPDSHTP